MAMLSDQQAREMTGYTTNNQNTLNALLDKLNSQRTLDATEVAQANALATQAKNFENQQALNKQQTIDTAEAAKAKQANDLILNKQQADLSLRNSLSTTKATAYKPVAGYTAPTNSNGGITFLNNNKQPITAAQYAANISADGKTVDLQVIKQLLSGSTDPNDQEISSEIDAAGNDQDKITALEQKYPWVFGG
jgi:hypothetical protein